MRKLSFENLILTADSSTKIVILRKESQWLLIGLHVAPAYVRFLLICYVYVDRGMEIATCLLACLYQSKLTDFIGFMGGF